MRALALLAVLPACILYQDGDDAVYCDDGEYVPYELVDPGNLTCQDFGGYQCNARAELAVPIPSWGECTSDCRNLDEGECLGASGCRVAYDWACYTGEGPCTALIPFLGCYPVDQSGPVQGACDGLDAWGCSQHDDCVALHDSNNAATFVRCVPENR